LLTSLIPAIQEADIRRIVVSGHPGEKKKNLLRPHFNQYLGMMVYTCHPRYVPGLNRCITVQTKLSINRRFYSKNNYRKKQWGVTQGVQCLEALSSIPNTINEGINK
jgi:hypothetical protein